MALSFIYLEKNCCQYYSFQKHHQLNFRKKECELVTQFHQYYLYQLLSQNVFIVS